MSRNVGKLVVIGSWDWAVVLTFARRCRDFGIAVHFLEVLSERPRVPRPPFSCLAAPPAVITWKELTAADGPSRVRAFVDQAGADAVLSADEYLLLWLARNRDIFGPDYQVLAAPEAVYDRLLSRNEQIAIARQAGFDVLESWYVGGPGDGGQTPPADSYPLCVRPGFPNSVEPSFKAQVLRSPSELEAFLASRKRIDSPLVAQPFHLGPNLVMHCARDLKGNIVGMQAFVTIRKYGGYALSIERADVPQKLLDAAARFAQASGMVGVFHFDLLRSNATGRTLFLEINPRMGGTTSKVLQLGYDEPQILLRCFGIEPPRQAAPLPAGRAATGKRGLLLQISALLKNQQDDLRYPLEGRWQALGRSLFDLVFARDQVLRLSEPRASLWYLLHKHGQ